MQEIVINRCYGGFSLSRKAFLRLRELGQKDALGEPDWGEPWGAGSGIREVWGIFAVTLLGMTHYWYKSSKNWMRMPMGIVLS